MVKAKLRILGFSLNERAGWRLRHQLPITHALPEECLECPAWKVSDFPVGARRFLAALPADLRCTLRAKPPFGENKQTQRGVFNPTRRHLCHTFFGYDPNKGEGLNEKRASLFWEAPEMSFVQEGY